MKVRQQTVMSRSIVDTADEMLKDVAEKGISVLYKGFGFSVLRDVTYSSIYCYLYFRFRGIYARLFNRRSDENICIFLGGATGASIASIVTTPLDVIKTTSQLSSERINVVKMIKHIVQVL